jgi:hypothetical protein
MMNERLQAKYMTVLEDMYVTEKFTLVEMRSKHKVSQYFIIIVKKLGYIQKINGKKFYTWCSGTPTKRHLNRIKVELMTVMLKKKKTTPRQEKTVIKLFWGLITYEK